jgi:hypothetical protein
MLTRRLFGLGLVSVLAAPAIVRAAALMPVRAAKPARTSLWRIGWDAEPTFGAYPDEEWRDNLIPRHAYGRSPAQAIMDDVEEMNRLIRVTLPIPNDVVGVTVDGKPLRLSRKRFVDDAGWIA